MRTKWFGVFLVLFAASTAQAQQWSGAYNPYANYGSRYYSNPYYGNPQAYAPRYYPQQYNSGYYSQATPTYYATPTQNYYPAVRSYAPPQATRTSGPVYSPAGPETIVEVQPQDMRPGTTVQMLPTIPTTMEPDRTNSRVRKVGQIDGYMMQEGPPSGNPDRGNVAHFWDSVCSAFDGGEPAAAFQARPTCKYFWVSAEYLASFIRPMRLAGPLITSGSLNDDFPGSLGQPTTVVLYGNQNVNFNLASGGRIAAGAFIDGQSRVSIEGVAFGIFPERQAASFASDVNGTPLFTRPKYSLDENRPGSYFISVPTLVTGASTIDFTSRMFGAEFNFRYHGCLGNSFRYDLLAGARYVSLQERMTIQDNYTGINGTPVPFNGMDVDSIFREDRFGTQNHFAGAQIGGRMSWEHRWVSLSGFAKLGFGGTVQRVNIDGYTIGASAAGTASAAGGVLALPTNIGNYSRTVFGVMPELGFNVGVNVTEHLRLQLGYSSLIWNSVVRPGSQYGLTQNSSQAPSAVNYGLATGPVAPIFRMNDELFWVDSLSLGLEFHY